MRLIPSRNIQLTCVLCFVIFGFWRPSNCLPALESGEETTLVGGQAVLEGVMMRSPHAWGICIRKPDGSLATHSEPLEKLSDKHKWMAWPFVRGIMTLGQAMTLGFRALRYSADVALDQLPMEEGKKTEISGWMIAVNLILSLGFFIFMYKFVPLLAATKLKNHYPAFGNQILFNVVDGADPHRTVPAVYLGHLAVGRHQAGLSIPRRRAQDGIRLRDQRPADHKERAVLYHLPSALRHQLPDDRDADRDGGLHAVPATTFWARFAFRIALLPVIAGRVV